MTLDAHHIVIGLEVAGAVTAGYLVMIGIVLWAAMPRLRARWQAHQPARIPLPVADPAAIRARLTELLAPYGFAPVGSPGGPFTMEPSGFRKWQGAKPVMVVFPPGGGAMVSGEARYVAKLTSDRKVFFETEGAVPFWPWVRQKLTVPITVLTALLFVAILCVTLTFL